MTGWRGAGRRVVTALALLAALSPAVRAQATGCEPGEREVRSLEFRGNHVFRASDLALRVVTTPSDFARRALRVVGTKHCLDSDELHLDVARLRVFYRRHGYYQTAVDTSVVAATDGYGGVRVAFLINEGAPVLVDTLSITGITPTIAGIVDTASLRLRRGIVFDVTVLQAAIDSMKARLRNNGYPRADVAASFSVFDTLGRRASVSLDVLPGMLAHVGDISVVDEANEGAPRRLGDTTIIKLLGVRRGDLYSERAIVDAQRALYQTDLFQHVEVGLADSASAAGDSIVPLAVHVHESYFRQLDTEVGWAVLDCFKVRAALVDKNFLGEARRMELTAQLSKIGYGQPTRFASGNLCAPAIRADTFSATLNYFAGASLRLPTLFGLRNAPTLSVYSERRGEYQAFLRTTLVGGEAAVTHEIAHDLPVRFAYSLEYGRTEAQPALLCAVFNRCDAESRALITDRNRPLAVGSAHLERIRTDNPFNPRAGTALRLDVRGSAREIGSDPDMQFLKGLSDASVYRSVNSWMVLAGRLRLGTVLSRTLSFGDTTGFVPPQERLYAGGAASVRGFQQNELGDLIYIAEDAPVRTAGSGDTVYLAVPNEKSPRRVVPVGGNSLIVANLEMRLRSFFYPELVQFTLFADAGDVWQRGRAGSSTSHKASALWLNGLKWTPGVGMRAFTPVGPFQVNVGYNPFVRPLGAIYYDQAPDARGFAPLYCVSPGNRVPAVPNADGQLEQVPGFACPATFQPGQSRTFLSRLTVTFSIGPDF